MSGGRRGKKNARMYPAMRKAKNVYPKSGHATIIIDSPEVCHYCRKTPMSILLPGFCSVLRNRQDRKSTDRATPRKARVRIKLSKKPIIIKRSIPASKTPKSHLNSGRRLRLQYRRSAKISFPPAARRYRVYLPQHASASAHASHIHRQKRT